jgi:hypothetical protein
VDHRQDHRFAVEVWNPFAAAYQVANTVEDGLKRVEELAHLISRMWLQRHPKRDVLVDVPDAADIDRASWAEFRINATAFRSYDTRYDARTVWARATSLTQAAATTCSRVGYKLLVSTAT